MKDCSLILMIVATPLVEEAMALLAFTRVVMASFAVPTRLLQAPTAVLAAFANF